MDPSPSAVDLNEPTIESPWRAEEGLSIDPIPVPNHTNLPIDGETDEWLTRYRRSRYLKEGGTRRQNPPTCRQKPTTRRNHTKRNTSDTMTPDTEKDGRDDEPKMMESLDDKTEAQPARLGRLNSWVVAKQIIHGILYICLATSSIYVYTLVGGIILFELDKSYDEQVAMQDAAAVAAQNFTSEQLAWLSGYDIPTPPPDDGIDIFESQLFALTLVTTIGYGNRTCSTAGSRWFAVFYSILGIILVGSLVLQMGRKFLVTINSFFILLLNIFLPVRFSKGRAAIMSERAMPLYDEMDVDGDGALYLWQIRQLLITAGEQEDKCLDAERDPEEAKYQPPPLAPPDWESVCTMAIKADTDYSGEIDREEFPAILEQYAETRAEEQEKAQYSILVFKVALLVGWMLLGATFYSQVCSKCIGNFGTSLYFVFVTLTTIGYGDYVPCTTGCEQFWFFHTAWGLGLMAVVIDVLAFHIILFATVAGKQKVELSPNYSYSVDWGKVGSFASRFPVLLNVIKSVGFIMTWVVIGAAVFMAYEHDPAQVTIEALQADIAAQNFTASQLQFLDPYFELALTNHWTFTGAMRFCMETITTVGYGDWTPKTSGGQTFIVFYAITGIGLVAMQLSNLASFLASIPIWLWDTSVPFFTHRKFSQRELDEQMQQLLGIVMENFDLMLEGRHNIGMDDLRSRVHKLKGVKKFHDSVIEAMLQFMDDDGDLNIECRVASIKIAHLYGQVAYQNHLWRFFSGLAMTILIFVISLPTFMVLENWSAGTTLWFMYITGMTIGLGDMFPNSTGASAYWYFYVLWSIGLISLLFFSAQGIFEEFGRRYKRHRTIHKQKTHMLEMDDCTATVSPSSHQSQGPNYATADDDPRLSPTQPQTAEPQDPLWDLPPEL